MTADALDVGGLLKLAEQIRTLRLLPEARLNGPREMAALRRLLDDAEDQAGVRSSWVPPATISPVGGIDVRYDAAITPGVMRFIYPGGKVEDTLVAPVEGWEYFGIRSLGSMYIKGWLSSKSS